MTFTKTFQAKLTFDTPAALMHDKGVEQEIADACLCLKNLMKRWIVAERTGQPIRVGYVGEVATILEGYYSGHSGTVVCKRFDDAELVWTVSVCGENLDYTDCELMVAA